MGKNSEEENHSSKKKQTEKVADKDNFPVVMETLPVKIDPEEEKRLFQLRKKINASEQKREILETQYLSLRSCYVHANKKLKHIHNHTENQIEFLQEVVKNRNQVLGLQRVRLAMAQNLLECLKHPVSNTNDEENNKEKENDEEKNESDLVTIWNEIEAELEKAEKKCVEM